VAYQSILRHLRHFKVFCGICCILLNLWLLRHFPVFCFISAFAAFEVPMCNKYFTAYCGIFVNRTPRRTSI
jgi:hypothetical protein